ncbi:MAG: FMN-binding protein [Planctomycetes bacterium]|nr:FMN-binding protein [Planctomycetota bacterium]
MSDEPQVQEPEDNGASSAGIIATLAVAGMLAGLLLVVVYEATQPRILAYKEKMMKEAVGLVLQEPASFTTLYLVDGKLTLDLPEDAVEKDFEKVFVGYDEHNSPVGFAVVHNRAGFQDQVKVIFGYDPETGGMMGMKVLESKETPGLGDAIEKDMDFVGQFERVVAPLVGVKKGSGSGDPHEVDMITGATISARAVIRIINEAFERWEPLIKAYDHGGSKDA